MRKKRVWRYYCDHCRKGGCSAGHIAKHEKHCLRNPSRECRLCEAPSRDFKALGKILAAHGIDKLLSAVDNCPNCALATIIQTRDPHDEETAMWDWNYKQALEEWWAEKNAMKRQEEDAYNAAQYNQGIT